MTLSFSPAFAQEVPKFEQDARQPGGLCAPWHRCVAYGALAAGAITVVIFGIGYAVQSRGFDRLEHRQGKPEGVPTGKQ